MKNYLPGHLRLTVGLLLAVLSAPDQAFPKQDIRFKHLSIEDGLSQSSVEYIVQDHSGFMWFATEDGLNRYDGNEFRIFINDPEDPWSISNNNIWCLCVDRNGILWIGTFTGGLNSYDPESERFTRYLHDSSDPHSISSDRIRSIAEDPDGYLWIGTRNEGLNRLDMKTGRFTRFVHDPESENSLLSDNIRFVMPDSNNTLWIATNAGVCHLDVLKGEFTHYRPGEGSNSLSSGNVRHIFRDRSDVYWISTGDGLNRFEPDSGRFNAYRADPSDAFSISMNSIRKIFEDRQGHLWITTAGGGLNYFERKTGRFYSYQYDQGDPGSISSSSTRIVFQDKGGLIWIGTLGGGLNIYDPKIDRFHRYRHDPEDPNSLSDPIVWSISQDPEGSIWFGLDSGDVISYDRDTGRYTPHPVISSIRSEGRINYFRCMLWDDSGSLWLAGRYSGISRYEPSSGKVESMWRDSPAYSYARSIYRDQTGEMWICASGGGLFYFDETDKTTINIRHDPNIAGSMCDGQVITILQDSDMNYWVGTSLGLSRMNLPEHSGTITPETVAGAVFSNFYHDPNVPNSISNSYVVSIHEHSSGDLYFGTMQGLSRIRREDRGVPKFTRYFMKDGLPNDVVYGILEDSHGNLWLSTNKGLSRFDPQAETFRNFDVQDGLHGNEFNSGVYTDTEEGTLIFGGVNGASEFHPDSLKDNPYIAPIVLTGFNIFDRPAELDRSITFIKEIVLSHSDNYFSFEFASLDYSVPDRNQYSYMLDGLDKDWTNAGNRRFAGYTHVDPGEYLFKVKGTNGDGIWNEEAASIRIVITPPFWRTWWFIAMIILAVGGGIASIIIYRVRQMLKFERLRIRIAEDLHDDIGAGLTEISIMGDIIDRKLPGPARELVDSELLAIGRASRGLIGSMSDIVWLVNPKKDSLFDLITRLGDSYQELTTSIGINLRIQNLESLRDTRLSMECRQNLFLIFKEGINNSLKYADCTEISLEVAITGKTLHIRLSDDGSGFDIDNATSGNGLKNMKNRAEQIGGRIDIISSSENGTTIEFTGPRI